MRAASVRPRQQPAVTAKPGSRVTLAVVRRTALYAVIAAGALLMLVPFAWTVASSLRPDVEIFRHTSPFGWRAFAPTRPQLDSYSQVLFQDGFIRYLGNSLIVSGTVLALGLVVNALAAYAFARFRFPGRDLLFVVVLITFMIPFETIVVPLYLVVDRLGWINTYQGLIAPGIADAIALFLLRQFFLALPRELEEAAALDGAGPLRIFVGILLPLSVPAIITAGLTIFIFQWNSFFWPLVATRSNELWVVQVGISRYVVDGITFWSKMFAASVIGSLPPIILYIIFQRYYLPTVSTTGLK